MAKKEIELEAKFNKSGDVEILKNKKFVRQYCWLDQERRCSESCVKFVELAENVFSICDIKCKITNDERVRK